MKVNIYPWINDLPGLTQMGAKANARREKAAQRLQEKYSGQLSHEQIEQLRKEPEILSRDVFFYFENSR